MAGAPWAEGPAWPGDPARPASAAGPGDLMAHPGTGWAGPAWDTLPAAPPRPGSAEPALPDPVLEAPVLEVPVLEAPVLEAPAAHAPEAPAPSGGWRRLRRWPFWELALPPLLTLAVVTWRIQGPSYWRDEGATLSAVTRPAGDLLRMLGHADAVHGAYYLVVWTVVRVFGTAELVTRLPSAVAMAVAAIAVAGIGRRLVSRRAGLLAGLVFAALPEVSRYGQEARSYATVSALAAVASYLLVRVLAEAGPRRRRWLIGYGAAVAGLGVVNIFGLVIIPAHGLTVLLASRRARAAGTGAGGRGLRRGWLAAIAATVAVTSPVLAYAWQQQGAQEWLKPPSLSMLAKLPNLIGSPFLGGALLLVIIGGVATSRAAGRAAADWPGRLPALCLPWLLMPPAILILLSFIHPVYTLRYVLYCLPAVAVLAGAGLAALGWRTGLVALAVVVGIAVPGQLNARRPAAHGDNIRQADRIIAANRQPGDAVLYTGRDARYMAAAYPFGLPELRNVALKRTKNASATLAGTYLHGPHLRHRLMTRVQRLWVISVGANRQHLRIMAGLDYRLVRVYQTSDLWLSLYVHRVPPGAVTPSTVTPSTVTPSTVTPSTGRGPAR
ncbi:MAG TPA: glycosyltransferase family 39 protein [Streptosporangiaceae bacterium]|nr:glycosyltransferase family 39 protein [Streptosporangiaceae bacterium]